MNLYWLVVPFVLTIGGVAVVRTIQALDDARRSLREQVVALGEARSALGPVQRRIDATRVAAVERTRR